jgi:adenylate cyclase
LSPLDRNIFAYYSAMNLAYYSLGSYEEAVKWGRLSASENPSYTSNLRYLAAALAALDRLDEAREVAGTLMTRDPAFRLSRFERTLQPFRDRKVGTQFMEHMRKAGLPD